MYRHTTYQEVPVRIDVVSHAGDEETQVGRGEEEGGDRGKHHPALQQRHRHIGRCHQDPY